MPGSLAHASDSERSDAPAGGLATSNCVRKSSRSASNAPAAMAQWSEASWSAADDPSAAIARQLGTDTELARADDVVWVAFKNCCNTVNI